MPDLEYPLTLWHGRKHEEKCRRIDEINQKHRDERRRLERFNDLEARITKLEADRTALIAERVRQCTPEELKWAMDEALRLGLLGKKPDAGN